MRPEHKAALATAGFLVLLGAGSIAFGPTRAPQAVVLQINTSNVVKSGHDEIVLGSAGEGVEPVAARDLIVPIAGVSTRDLVDSYGAARGEGRTHQGIDIMAPLGTPVRAAAQGTILKLFTSARGGFTVYQADETGALVLYYAHLSGYVPTLREGTRVAQGEVIAYVGQSGNATVPHLHFEVQHAATGRQWWRGQAVNPYLALKAGRAAPPTHASLGGRGR